MVDKNTNGRRAVSFSIRKQLIEEFTKLCEEKGLIMSRRIEKCMEAEIEKIKKIENLN